MSDIVLMTAMLCSGCCAGDILQKLGGLEQFSQFTSLLKSTEGLHLAHLDNFVTVFVPSNDAMEAFGGVKDDNLILNHMVDSSISPTQLGDRLTSLVKGHPTLWVRKLGSSLFINQARVLANYPMTSRTGKKQHLYLIDSVLEPLVPQEKDAQDILDTRAADLLWSNKDLRISNFSIKTFTGRIYVLGLETLPELNEFRKFTLFIPIDSAFKNLQVHLIDEEVVRAHIIPNYLLFTKPQKRRADSKATLQYNSTRGSLSLKVMAKVSQKTIDGTTKPMAISETVVGNKQHQRGVVEAMIVKGNIPVQNGIVHLIDKPLVIMTNTLTQMMGATRFQIFCSHLEKYPDLVQKIKQTSQGTILIPTNEAFKEVSDREIDENILSLHFLDRTILTSDARIRHTGGASGKFGVHAMHLDYLDQPKVWFWKDDDKLLVEGGGVQAEVVDDVLASNGVIHSVDRVLGIPYKNMFQKVSRDPNMQTTFKLGQQGNFNNWVLTEDIQSTYLVPTDQAWEQARLDYPSAYKVLTLGYSPYRVTHLLERHAQVGAKLSLDQLVLESVNGGGLEVTRGSPVVVRRTVENGEEVITVGVAGVRARVVRGDIESTNGYIHTIDRVLFKMSDVTLSRAILPLAHLAGIMLPWAVVCWAWVWQ